MSPKTIVLSCSCYWINYFTLNGFTTTVIFIWVVPTVINPIAHLLRLQAYSVISASVRSCRWAKKFGWKKRKKQSSSFGYTDLWGNPSPPFLFCFGFFAFLFPSFQIHNQAFLNIFCGGNCLHVGTRKWVIIEAMILVIYINYRKECTAEMK